MPAIDDVIVNMASSHWLKTALQSALQRDPVDAANDAELLSALLNEWADAVSHAHGPAST